MSQIASPGGTFPSAGASADQVLAFFKVLADPALHEQRLNELMAAEQSANAAHDAAAQAQQLAAQDKAAADAKSAELQQREDDLAKNTAAFNERVAATDASLQGREAAVAELEKHYQEQVQAATDWHDKTSAELQQAADAIAAREAAVTKREQDADKAEARINAKLAKLKEFEDA